jgi:hypothetical protein
MGKERMKFPSAMEHADKDWVCYIFMAVDSAIESKPERFPQATGMVPTSRHGSHKLERELLEESIRGNGVK